MVNTEIEFERKVDEWQKFTPKNRKATLKASKATIKSIQAVRLAHKDIGSIFPPADAPLWQELDVIETVAKMYAKRAQGTIRYNKQKDSLLGLLLTEWLMAGGGAVGGTAVDGTSDNPFIRYLVAAARPAGIGLTPDAARGYQRKSGGRLQETIGAKAIDNIPDSHSSPTSAVWRAMAKIARNDR